MKTNNLSETFSHADHEFTISVDFTEVPKRWYKLEVDGVVRLYSTDFKEVSKFVRSYH